MTAIHPDTLSDRDHQRVAHYIEATAGIQLPASKRTLVEGRLRKRQRKHGHATLHEYIKFALDTQAGVPEKLHLLDAITTNKTDFYREPSHFSILCDHIRGVYATKTDMLRPLRLWSAGCSSGEEPYTLAFEMLELSKEIPQFKFEIDATDISPSCLAKAKQAVYEHARIEPVPMNLRQRYLLRSRDKSRNLIRISPEVRQHVTFSRFNLLGGGYDARNPYDIIFCRNVMIYFDNETRIELAKRFASVLAPDGILFIGHSETLLDAASDFRQLKPNVYQTSMVDR